MSGSGDVEGQRFSHVEERRFSAWKSGASARGRAALQRVEERRFSAAKAQDLKGL